MSSTRDSMAGKLAGLMHSKVLLTCATLIERRLKTLKRNSPSLTLASALAGVALLTPACIVPKTTCEYTKTCVTANKDASVAPSDTETTRTHTSADGASVDVTPEAGVRDAALDASLADAGASPSEAQKCERLMDCPAQLPVCHATEGVCTECDDAFDCNATPGRPLCKQRPGRVQDNRCVQCLTNADCGDDICVNDKCVKCNTRTNDGCTSSLPHCTLVDDTPTCVACVTNDHCTDELPVCSEHRCVLCTSGDATHCPVHTPVCAADETPPRCVGCRDDGDCSGFTLGGVEVTGLCLEEQCTLCELGTNRNCTESYPFCVALLPTAEGGTSLFTPAETNADTPSEQYLDFEHQCVECLDDVVCDGSRKLCHNGSCVECTRNEHCQMTEASVCDTNTNTCVGCSEVGDCTHLPDTPACDAESQRCVECTAERGAVCGNHVCRTVPGEGQFTCVNSLTKSAGICRSCLSDAHCPNNSACVLEVYQGQETGYYCLPIEGRWEGGVPCIIGRQFTTSWRATSIDGVRGTFCKPTVTSCQAISDYAGGREIDDFGAPTCNDNDDCGLPATNDGACIRWTASINRCTYTCTSDSECLSGSLCLTTVDVNDDRATVCSPNNVL